MKSKYRKYNNGGPVKPKKRKKEFTDRSEFLNRLSAYNDSLYAANTSEAALAYFDEVLGDYSKYHIRLGDHDLSDRVSYADLLDKNSNIVGKPYDLNVTATKDNFVAPSALDRLSGDDQLKVSTTNRQLNYKNYQLKNPQKPVERYTYQPPSVVLSDTKYSLGSSDDKIKMRTYKDGDPKWIYINEKTNPFWRYNHRYTLQDNIYDSSREFVIDKFQQPNVEPVYTGKSTVLEDYGREEANEFTKEMNPQVDSLYNTPGALAKYQDRFMDRMLRAAVPADTTYYDPNLGATVSAGIYEPGQSNGKYSYFKVSTDNPSDISSTSKKPIRPKERMLELPPKLPFPNIDLNKLPALRRVLPEIYSRKLNQQKGEYIYRTSEGQVRKRIGQEDADYVRMNRAAIDRMRQKLR